jgi:hypothetical protein
MDLELPEQLFARRTLFIGVIVSVRPFSVRDRKTAAKNELWDIWLATRIPLNLPPVQRCRQTIYAEFYSIFYI